MTLYMNIKQLGKRKNTVHKVPFEYDTAPSTLRELITETVKICVAHSTYPAWIAAMQC